MSAFPWQITVLAVAAVWLITTGFALWLADVLVSRPNEGAAMKKLLIFVPLIVALGVAFGLSIPSKAHAVCQRPAGANRPACGGATCSFNVVVPAHWTSSDLCARQALAWVTYSRDGFPSACTDIFFSLVNGGGDYRCGAVNSITFYAAYPDAQQTVAVANYSNVAIHVYGNAGP